jgi:hypothetical protein
MNHLFSIGLFNQNGEILTAAVNEYPGTLIVVSHDEHFLIQIDDALRKQVYGKCSSLYFLFSFNEKNIIIWCRQICYHSH